MWEKWIGEVIAGLLGVIMVFFWNKQKDQDRRIEGLESSNTDAHNRITKQGETNNDKFARRDDVLAMESRIIEAMNTGLESLKSDIRSQNNNGGGG